MTSEFYAHVKVGNCDIAVPASDIVQAIVAPEAGPTPLPRHDGQKHGALAGVIDFAGGLVPVVALDRWVPLGAKGGSTDPRILILRKDRSLVGIQVGALKGLKQVEVSAIRTVCHDGSEEELFEAVAPADADRPQLCLLDVARLMGLANAWCKEADVKLAAATADTATDRTSVGSIRYVVFQIANEKWAVPASAVSRLDRTPKPEFRLAGQRVCGIGTWGARKVPFVDLGFAHDEAGASRPWMAIVTSGPQAIGLLVDSCERLVNLASNDVVPTPGEELRRGTALLSDLGRVSVLDVDQLFAAVPEATISVANGATDRKLPSVRSVADSQTRASAGSEEPSSKVSVDGSDSPDYLVFDADRSYASPATGLLGVVALPQAAIDDFAHGRRATIDWRGQTIAVVGMPRIDGGKSKFEPRVAVVVNGAGGETSQSAVAVHSLSRWLPARSVQRSTMHIHSVGEVSVVMPPGAQRSESLVIVDLAQMAFLLH